MYFLINEFNIEHEELLNENEIESRKERDYIIDNIFIPYVNTYLKYENTKKKYNEFLFLFDCYVVTFKSEFKRMNIHFDKKLLKLTYTFKLKNNK